MLRGLPAGDQTPGKAHEARPAPARAGGAGIAPLPGRPVAFLT